MSRVLVTGATTPIGLALMRRLMDDPAVEHVLAVGFETAATRRGLAETARLSYRAVDLTRSRQRHQLLYGPARELAVDVVVHLALHRSATLTGPRVHQLNVESTRDLLRLAEHHPTIRRFVFRSHAEVYRLRAEEPVLLGEEDPLELSPRAPQWIRDRVEADLTVCTRMGLSPLSVVVLRCAECLAAGTGSQLWDYLRSRVCFRPLGYDPMLNLITPQDLSAALALAVRAEAQGLFNIPGADTLPLSEVVRKSGRLGVAVPGPLLTPLYLLRRLTIGTDFRYDLNVWRFHYSGVLDGGRARRELGYVPSTRIQWPAD